MLCYTYTQKVHVNILKINVCGIVMFHSFSPLITFQRQKVILKLVYLKKEITRTLDYKISIGFNIRADPFPFFRLDPGGRNSAIGHGGVNARGVCLDGRSSVVTSVTRYIDPGSRHNTPLLLPIPPHQASAPRIYASRHPEDST